MLRRIGKASFQYAVREQAALLGVAGVALKLLPEKQRMRFEVDATALQRADNGVASLEYAAQMRRRDASEIPVILALFRTMAAGHSVTAIVVRLS